MRYVFQKIDPHRSYAITIGSREKPDSGETISERDLEEQKEELARGILAPEGSRWKKFGSPDDLRRSPF